MNTTNRVSAWMAVLAISGAGATSGVLAGEEDAPHELRKIMVDLGDHMVGITEGITDQDWVRVAENAEAIVNHPRPPMTERIRVMAFVGTDVAKFQELDNEVHDAASRLADDAASGDGSAIIASFGRLHNGCLECHASFRASYREHLHFLATGD